MKTSHCILLLAQALAIAASPLQARNPGEVHLLGGARARGGAAEAAAPAEGAAEGAAGEAEAGEENEVEQAGQFDVPIALGGGNVKTDTLFPPGQNGVFEIEFQNAEGRTLTVTQNPNPAPPPAGFVALEPVSFIVNLAEGADGITLQKVDYILNKNNTLDISQGSIGRLDPATGAFVIGEAVGRQEFELEENELLVELANMNGEFAAFIPEAAAAAPPAADPAAEADAGAAVTQEQVQQFVSLLRTLLG